MQMDSSNRITKVAVVGAGGHSGSQITKHLLATGKHTVTAITRVDSNSELPNGVLIKKVDYTQSDTLVEALRGQDALVITLSGHALKLQAQIIEAAATAGVGWILPNEWSPDSANEALVKDVPMFQSKVTDRQKIVELGKSSYISVCTGFWYQWGMAVPAAFGFDVANRTVTFFDDGNTKICLSTLPQVGRAVAALLSLPISGNRACLESLRNKTVYVNSFTVSQQDILDSILRVTGEQRSDWKIVHQDIVKRYEEGVSESREGKRIGFAKIMYGRVFYQDGSGNFESGKGTMNALLDLPEEDLDAATKEVVETAAKGKGNWADGGKA